MKFQVGDFVRWKSRSTRKFGVVAAVVPAGQMPRQVGYSKLGKDSLSRDHESYVVLGGREFLSKRRPYWPVVSLLMLEGRLSCQEIDWCYRHPQLVRSLISSTREDKS